MTAIAERQVECFAGNIVEVPVELSMDDLMPDDLGEQARSDPSSPTFGQIDLGCFRIMTPKDGDKRVTWIRTIMAEVKAAKKMFMDLI